ncbi:type IV pilin protein [Acinetobacter qingfengensis]|nr:type IV pilin protein [Acinetobacter qingfengensis]
MTMSSIRGFTLVELMLVVIIVAIFAVVAIPSYQAYIRRSHAAAVQAEMLRLADQLEHYKSRNFSYHGFDPYYLYGKTSGVSSFEFPVQDDVTKRYTITLADVSSGNNDGSLLATNNDGLGQKWAINAIPKSTQYDAMLLTSTGVRCKTTYYSDADLTDISAYTGCGSSTASW